MLERATRTKQYEQDMKRIKSGLPLVDKSNNQSEKGENKRSEEPESEMLRRLKEQLDTDSSS